MHAAVGALIAMLVGIVGSSTIHLSKGVMRLGVTRMTAEYSGKKNEHSDRKKSAGKAIYVAGVLMNFTNPFWVIIANRFAPTIYYTSVYGIGLIALIVFARWVLGEPLTGRQITGVVLVGAATLLVGFTNLFTPAPSLYHANRVIIILVAGGWLVLGPLVLALTRRRTILLQGLFFGLIGGGFAALDALLKGIAQSGVVESTLLPQSPTSWLLFLFSFLGAGGAFAVIQWSYARGCRASVMGSAYNVSYVALPLLLTAIAVPGARMSVMHVIALAGLVLGVALVQLPRTQRDVAAVG